MFGILESKHKGLNPAFAIAQLSWFGTNLLLQSGFPLLMMAITFLTGVYVCVMIK